MAKDPLLNLKRFLRTAISESLRLKGDAIGKLVVDDIKRETRAGIQFNKEAGGRTQKHRPLSRSTVNFRKYIQRTPTKKHPTFSPARSNLTISGQLLDALTHKSSPSRRIVNIFVKDTKRRPYRRLPVKSGGIGRDKRKRESELPTNKEVAEALDEIGRGFLGVDSQTLSDIENLFLSEFRRILARLKLT